MLEINDLTVDKVDEASRCGHDYLGAFTQCANLALYARATVDRGYSETLYVF